MHNVKRLSMSLHVIWKLTCVVYEGNLAMPGVENPFVGENEKTTWKHLACHQLSKLWAVTNNNKND